jgi:hypothetical protein
VFLALEGDLKVLNVGGRVLSSKNLKESGLEALKALVAPTGGIRIFQAATHRGEPRLGW